MTLLQDAVKTLQSRTAKRGRYIAGLESERTALKAALATTPRSSQLRQALRSFLAKTEEAIAVNAADQKFDRVLLKPAQQTQSLRAFYGS